MANGEAYRVYAHAMLQIGDDAKRHVGAPGIVEIGGADGSPTLAGIDIGMEQAKPAASEAVATFYTLIRQSALTADQEPQATDSLKHYP